MWSPDYGFPRCFSSYRDFNGAWDKYTSAEDARCFGELASDARFVSIAHTGHFLELEHKTALQDTRPAVAGFVLGDTAGAEKQKLALAG